METYTRRDRAKAINWAALLGWAAFALEYLLRSGNFFGLVFFALYGLPISFGLVWLLAGPLVWLAMRRTVSWLGALGLGIGASGIMAGIGFTWNYWSRSQANQNPNFGYQTGGGEYVRDVDGILTLSCCRFRGHRVKVFNGTGDFGWRDASSAGSSSSKL
jgi:hypothetical protein